MFEKLDMHKRGMTGALVGLAIGIVILAVVAVIGTVVVSQLGTAQGAGIANDSAQYAAGYLGSTRTGGLLTWLPVIIPAVIGFAIIAMFLRMRIGGGGY